MKAETLRLLQAATGRQGMLIVGSWEASNPKQVKAWEADGSLLRRVLEANKLAAEATRLYDQDKQANPGGLPALASHEIYELYGGPMLKL